jgi:hypothetical protein
VRKKRRKRGDLMVSHLILFIYPLTLSLFINVIKRYAKLVAGIGLGQFAPGEAQPKTRIHMFEGGQQACGIRTAIK